MGVLSQGPNTSGIKSTVRVECRISKIAVEEAVRVLICRLSAVSANNLNVVGGWCSRL